MRVSFEMNEEKKVTGTALNQKTKEKYTLDGSFEESGTLNMAATNAEGKPAGTFTGSILANYMFKGNWKNGGNAEAFMFTKVSEELMTSDEEFLGGSAVSNTASAKPAGPKKAGALAQLLLDYQACEGDAANDISCQGFTAKAICQTFSIDDFKDPHVDGSYINMTEIHEYVKNNGSWKKIGMATDQTVLDEAVKAASNGKVVIAAKPYGNYSQIAMILEGQLAPSSSWKLNVPTSSAVFFYGRPQKSFDDKKLSFVWSGPSEIELWVRQ
ncbi:hypothetical protein V6R21_23190 [Limibacter armeniacum]|uniref:hypothetical protein n=1 Tax=Limibacter armeniacum TaxID=466084 RepID=UPI002FE5C53D